MIDRPNAATALIKVARRRNELLATEPMRPGGKPMPPVGEITPTRVGLRVSWGNLRFMFLLPWLLGLCGGLWWHASSFLRAWESQEKMHQEFVSASIKKYGANYFDVTADEGSLWFFNNLDPNGSLTIRKYMDIRYRDSVGAERRRQTDIFLALLFGLGIPGLSIAILSFHRKAPLYFDRQRRIAYTWRRGQVWAQHYDALWYYSNHATMVFILYGFDRKGRFGPRRFVVTPNGSPWFNGETLYTDVLAFVARFMENGRDDVWPTDWEGRRGLYLFEDRKPDDFDAQLQRVLTHIDREGVNAQADALATQWGFSA